MKQVLFQTSILTNPHLGLYTITTYYDDCSHDKVIAPLGLIIQPTYIIPPGELLERYSEAPRPQEDAPPWWFSMIAAIVTAYGFYVLIHWLFK